MIHQIFPFQFSQLFHNNSQLSQLLSVVKNISHKVSRRTYSDINNFLDDHLFFYRINCYNLIFSTKGLNMLKND